MNWTLKNACLTPFLRFVTKKQDTSLVTKTGSEAQVGFTSFTSEYS